MGLAGAALTACTPGTAERPGRPATTEPSPPLQPSPDERLAAGVASSVSGLVAAYDATLTRHRGLAGRIVALLAETQAHLDALQVVVTRSPSTVPAVSPVPPAPRPVPADPAAALAALAGHERALARSRPGAIVGVGADLAMLIATVGAAEAVHATLLSAPP